MERLNKIFAEWAKQDKRTELASEKVELGIIDDVDKLANEASKDYKKAFSAKEKASALMSSSLKKNRDAMLKLEKAEKVAKDLGFKEVLNKIQARKKDLKRAILFIENAISSLDKI